VTLSWRALPLALLLLGGCGMYGALYLEEPDPPAATAPLPAAVEPGVAGPEVAPAPGEDPNPDDDRDEDRDELPGTDPDADDPAAAS
jgi:hypothetical protein